MTNYEGSRRPTIIGDRQIFFANKREANYGRYLHFLTENEMIKGWSYQPTHFDLYPSRYYHPVYIPDFQIQELDGSCFYLEIINAFSGHYVAAMRREHPSIIIKTISEDDYKYLELNSRIPGWVY